MKKTIAALILAAATALTGCSDSDDNFVFTDQIINQNPPPVVNGFFVDATNGNDATGSFNGGLPFATIQGAVNAAPGGSDIIVRAGNYVGAINLLDGQRLLGEGSVLAQGNAVRPTLTGPVDLADGNTVDFLRIDGTQGDAIAATGSNSGTVTNCEIANTTNGGDGVCAENVSGTWNVSNNTITDVDSALGIGIDITTSGANAVTARVNNNVITGSGLVAIAFEANDSSQLTAQVNDNVLTGNAQGATFEAIAGNTATMCLDIEDNTNDDVYRFAEIDNATLQVEEFNNLAGVNTSGTTSVSPVSNPINNVIEGFCGF